MISANALLPQWPGEVLVLARSRLLVGEHIQQQAEWAHVEGHQDEPPFHHHRFGIVAVLIYADIERRGSGKSEPDNKKIVDRLDEHGQNLILDPWLVIATSFR